MSLHELGNGWDEHSGGNITGVTTALTTLSADNVDAKFEALLDVFGVSDHVHVENASLVELLNNVLGGHTDSTDEEFGATLDDDINELVELSLGVVMAGSTLVPENLHVIQKKLTWSFVRCRRPEAKANQHRMVHSYR